MGNPFASDSSSDRVSYSQSPEQQAIYNAIQPTIQYIGRQGRRGDPVWNTPTMERSTGYDLPSGDMLMPTQDWYSNLSPEVMAGLNAPYDDARDQLMERMGGLGQGGSAGAGYSGAAGAALGEFEATRANNIGLQAWQMTQPGLFADYNAQLGRNQWTANVGQQANVMEWQNRAESYKFPYTSLPGLVGGTYPSPIVDTSPSAANNMGAGLMGGMGGYGMGQQMGVNPWATAGIGAAGSYMRGK